MIIECTSALVTSPKNQGTLGPKQIYPKGVLTAHRWSGFLLEIVSKLCIRSWQLALINTSSLAGVGKGVNLTSQRCSNLFLALDHSTTLLLFAKFSIVQARTVLANLLFGLASSKEINHFSLHPVCLCSSPF
jgi:hypothetical protein